MTRRTKEEEEPVQDTNGVIENKSVMATLTPSALSDLSNLSFEALTGGYLALDPKLHNIILLFYGSNPN